MLIDIDLDAIKHHIHTHTDLRELVHEALLFDRVDSTNRMALEMASQGMPGGVAIFAEAQDKGRGRMNRTWFSPRGFNLYLSLLIRPHQAPREFPLFSMATAMALIVAIERVTHLRASLKWPNDIFLNQKKVAGILLESVSDGGQAPPLVIGIGVNVNVSTFPEALTPIATSLRIASGVRVDRNIFALTLLDTLAEQFKRLNKEGPAPLLAALRQQCRTLGQRVHVATPKQAWEGIAEAIQEDGALVLKMGDGTKRTLYMGDVTHLREEPLPQTMGWPE